MDTYQVFYFLNSSECTSKPVFHDPRPGHAMNGLPLKSTTEVTYGSPEIHYKTKPGTLIFFPIIFTTFIYCRCRLRTI